MAAGVVDEQPPAVGRSDDGKRVPGRCLRRLPTSLWVAVLTKAMRSCPRTASAYSRSPGTTTPPLSFGTDRDGRRDPLVPQIDHGDRASSNRNERFAPVAGKGRRKGRLPVGNSPPGESSADRKYAAALFLHRDEQLAVRQRPDEERRSSPVAAARPDPLGIRRVSAAPFEQAGEQAAIGSTATPSGVRRPAASLRLGASPHRPQ